MIDIDFVKMSGAGNDFILIDNRGNRYTIDWNELAPIISDRRYGVGADGLLIVEDSVKTDFRMKYYNSDGSFGGMCGNGGRCIALYIMNDHKKSEIKFEALDYIYSAKQIDNNVILRMKSPKDITSNIINISDEIIPLLSIDTGAPHVVIFQKDLSPKLRKIIQVQGIKNIGSQIRQHHAFQPSGTNVNFVDILDANRISMRTYERGVEDETLACGTGAIASAIASSINNNFASPVEVKARSGETLTIRFRREYEEFSEIELIGSAKKIFHGRFSFQDNY
jgi:diaminopimelate epimerase